MSQEKILAAIPHRPPFLLVDEIIEQSDAKIVGTKRFTGDEDFFKGHYPEFPLVPGVLLCEAAMQCGAVLLSHLISPRPLGEGPGVRAESDPTSPHPSPLPKGEGNRIPVATRMNDIRFKRMVRPGETIRMEVELTERLADAFFLKAKVTVENQVAVRFEFACTLANPMAAAENGPTR
jgi:3-hydroxyacyl-[acyl-carrier-protein] dehydratase